MGIEEAMIYVGSSQICNNEGACYGVLELNSDALNKHIMYILQTRFWYDREEKYKVISSIAELNSTADQLESVYVISLCPFYFQAVEKLRPQKNEGKLRPSNTWHKLVWKNVY